MSRTGARPERPEIGPFDRSFFDSAEVATRIGNGALGGKALGLLLARQVVAALPPFPGLEVTIPRMVVVTTTLFEAFLERNGLTGLAADDAPDERKAHACQLADLPVEMTGDLAALVDGVHQPLAVRSSSLLEDALAHPFAGVYSTKMTPNLAPDRATRLRRLIEAVKYVWSSALFASPGRYLRAIGRSPGDERMAVVIQEVVGRRIGDRFYPQVSGVARSWNFYPGGIGRPEDGVVSLALGLGKTIVDGEPCWTVSPARPTAPPPVASPRDLLRSTQSRFWAVHMGRPLDPDPLAEAEHLVRAGLAEAEFDGSLDFLASTYDPEADRLDPGMGGRGPRALTFAPLLGLGRLPLIDLVRRLLADCEAALGGPVEIEFALTLPAQGEAAGHFSLLQLRPMLAPGSDVEIADEELEAEGVLLTSTMAMGNGETELHDVVYVRPDRFDAAATREIAREVAALNAGLVADGRPYLLIGFGRWGSSDPWLGIPVRWDQISGARAVVEATLPEMNVEPSQGAHFFHNLASFGVFYLTVRPGDRPPDWARLDASPVVAEGPRVRHVRFDSPLTVRMDGRRGWGLVRWGGGPE